ncbi:uncharacterized protein [Anoplolepis gracilipes]|uniref:uncharacterized protein n=1 Tax=Anoplolepis gracilipes TaxID=354296 RepID=UPI003B9F4360
MTELICKLFNAFITLILVVFVVYYDKKLKKCLKRIAIVDDTLEQLGTTTNYQKLRKRTVWLILGWLMISIIMNIIETLWLKDQYNNLSAIIIIYVPCILNYCAHTNFVDDMIFITILGYLELKFDQINENLQKIIRNNNGITQVTDNHVLQSRQRKVLETLSSEHMIWIVMHLHLELCNISREVNSIFGLQLTLKMGLYFGFISVAIQEIFEAIFIKGYANETGKLFFVIFLWIIVHMIKLFFINYTCERVSAKANAAGDIINNAPYSICDTEIRENILQFLLQLTQAPLKFYGLGLFQFGFKFFQGFIRSVATVLTIIIQAHVNK